MIKTSVIPIVYMAGTGGHFLSAFLRKARLNEIESNFKLSVYGNCHNIRLDLGSAGGLADPLDEKIEIIKRNVVDHSITHYWPLHSDNIDHVMREFDKCIKITYTESDITDVAAIFYVKWGIEGQHITEPFKEFNFHRMLHDYQPYFCPNIDYSDRILNISWYELYHEDRIDDVIKKLSDYTNIPIDNFDKNFMFAWRRNTQRCLRNVNRFNNGYQYS